MKKIKRHRSISFCVQTAVEARGSRALHGSPTHNFSKAKITFDHGTYMHSAWIWAVCGITVEMPRFVHSFNVCFSISWVTRKTDLAISTWIPQTAAIPAIWMFEHRVQSRPKTNLVTKPKGYAVKWDIMVMIPSKGKISMFRPENCPLIIGF